MHPDSIDKKIQTDISILNPISARLNLPHNLKIHVYSKSIHGQVSLSGQALLALHESVWLSLAYCLCFACVTFKAIQRLPKYKLAIPSTPHNEAKCI